MFRSIARRFGSQSQSRRREQEAALRRRRMSLEKLDERRVFAADIYVTGTEVILWGDDTANSGTMELSGGKLKVEITSQGAAGTVHKSQEFNTSAVSHVYFTGGKGDDSFTNRTALSSTAYGGADNDRLTGGSGSDKLVGDAGNDVLTGGGGVDQLIGGEGNDTYNLNGQQSGAVTITEAANVDTDTLNYSATTGAGITLNLASTAKQRVGSHDLTLSSSTGIENAIGTSYADSISGNSRNNLLEGRGGNDTLYGLAGQDTLKGGLGNDVLRGGNDSDCLFGDAGNDRLFGDAAFDALLGGDNDDWLDAGSANEWVSGDGGWDHDAYRWAIDGASSGDVQQAGVGSCVFLSALSGAAHQGIDLASRVQYLGNYLYRVQLYNLDTLQCETETVYFDGAAVSVGSTRIDPWEPAEGEFWTILYQRAYLQMMHRIDEDYTDPDYAMFALTGRTVIDGDWDNPALIKSMLDLGFVVTAGDADETSVVFAHHSYTVLDVYCNNGVWCIKLRNPWGNDGGTETSGDPNDGVIDMTWEAFQGWHDFDRISIS